LIGIGLYSFVPYNTVLADNSKKVSIECAEPNPCLNGVCIGDGCSPSGNPEHMTDVSHNSKRSMSVEKSPNHSDQVNSNANSLEIFQNTIDENTCVKSPISPTVNTLGKKDANEDFKKIIDSNPNTKWSFDDGRSSVQMDLGEIRKICSISIHWYNGEKSSYNFLISSSIDGVNFTNILRGTSDNAHRSPENYPIITEVQGRYIRLDASRDSDASGVSDIEVYTKSINSADASADPSHKYLVSPNSQSSNVRLMNQITPNQYIDLISPSIETNHVQSMPDKNIGVTSSASAIQISLAGNGTNEASGLKFSIIDLPVHGILKRGLMANSVIYTPVEGFTGSDSFTYNAIDEHGTQILKGSVNVLVSNNYPL